MTERKLSYYLNNRNFPKIKEGSKKKVNTQEDEVSYYGKRYEDPEHVTSRTYMKKKPATSGRRWKIEEDDLFYDALSCCGCEFSMINLLFPSRTRHSLKLKYKRESKQNPKRIEYALSNFKRFDEETFAELKKRSEALEERK